MRKMSTIGQNARVQTFALGAVSLTTQRTQRKVLRCVRCVRCVVKETAPKSLIALLIVVCGKSL